MPKEIRDRIQNHALQDVNSKSYDRWNCMREKRTGMAKWDKFVRAMLSKKRSLSFGCLASCGAALSDNRQRESGALDYKLGA